MDDSEREILADLGGAVLVAQLVERILRFCMTLVFQKNSPLTLESLEQQDRDERKKTLGYFISQLRLRADLDENLEDLLANFLVHRNTLIHDVNDIAGWDLHSPEGRQIAREFLDNFTKESGLIIKIFTGVVLDWQQQLGWKAPDLPKDGFLADIETVYKPNVHRLFYQKS